MQFTSFPFLLLITLSLAVYYALPKARRWWCLLAASYIFYWFAGADCFGFILYTTAVTYLTAVWMQRMSDGERDYLEAHRDEPKEIKKAYKAKEKKKRFRVLTLGLCLGFGLLAVLKYTAFVLRGVNALGGEITIPNLLLPLGISF